jgi:hypothetical protein
MSAHDHLSPSQFRTYYHGTSANNVASIQKNGLHEGSYLASHPGTSGVYGEHVFKVSVPEHHEFAENQDEYHDNYGQHAGFKPDEVPGSDDLVTMRPQELKVEGPKPWREWLK